MSFRAKSQWVILGHNIYWVANNEVADLDKYSYQSVIPVQDLSHLSANAVVLQRSQTVGPLHALTSYDSC